MLRHFEFCCHSKFSISHNSSFSSYFWQYSMDTMKLAFCECEEKIVESRRGVCFEKQTPLFSKKEWFFTSLDKSFIQTNLFHCYSTQFQLELHANPFCLEWFDQKPFFIQACAREDQKNLKSVEVNSHGWKASIKKAKHKIHRDHCF